MSVKDEKMEGTARLDVESIDYAASDDALLEVLGYKQEFKRSFNAVEVFGLGFSIIGLFPSIA